MARISVYIPDDLLERARGARSRSVSGSRSGSQARSVSVSGSGSGSGSGSEAENTSQLIQRGLQCLIDGEERPPNYARSPSNSRDQINQLRDRLLAEAQSDYEKGYSVALEAAELMPLHVVNALVDVNFDLRAWLGPFNNGFNDELMEAINQRMDAEAASDGPAPPAEPIKTDEHWGWLRKTWDALGNLTAPNELAPFSFTPTKARERGYVDAMRELWTAIETPADDAGPSGEDGTSSDELAAKRSKATNRKGGA